MLPWLAVHERLGKPKYQCRPCLAANDYQARRTMLCGYVRVEDWLPAQASWGYIAGAPRVGPVGPLGPTGPTTCPGYTTSLPEVAEVADAWGWWERGQLGKRSDLPDSVVSLVSLFNQELNAAREWYYEESKPR